VKGSPTEFNDPLGWASCAPWLGMARDWFLGRGARERQYGEGSPQVEDLKRLPPVRHAVLAYRTKNVDELTNGTCCKASNLQPLTGYRWEFNTSRFIHASMNGSCAWHFLGTFAINVYPIDCKTAQVVVTNSSDTHSFFAGHGPVRRGNVLGGQIFQLYSWLETL
jgi:hypothetical protein